MMKHKILFAGLSMVVCWQLLTAALRDPNNPPTARTGAPGETTCAASGCHSGGSFTGTVAISGVPDTIAPGQSYTITLLHTSNAVRAGFELTCLDGSNAKCGNLTASSGTSVGNVAGSGRQYVRQSTPKTLSGGSTSWSFTWKAPASASGDKATFYFTSLAANGNGKESGDNVLVGTKISVFQPLVAAHEAVKASWFKLYPTTAQTFIRVELLDAGKGELRLFDQQGRQVLYSQLSANNTVQVNHLQKGLYFAQVTAAGRQSTQKLLVD